MGTLLATRGVQECMKQAAARAAQPLFTVAAVPRQRLLQLRTAGRCFAGLDTSNGASSSSSISSNGWLLDTAPSLDISRTSHSSSSNGEGSPVASRYDAIMMLGGGLLPSGGLPEWVLRRLEGSLRLYQQQQRLWAAPVAPSGGDALLTSPPAAHQQQQSWRAATAGPCPILMLGAATPHKPPVLDDLGYVLYESTAYAAYLVRRGVPAGDLLKETQSSDTVGNGYFSLLMHALPAGWRRIAVVTSEFHIPRTRATFDFIYSLAGGQLHGDSAWYSLEYQAVSDEGIFAPEVIEARAAKEAAAMAAWHNSTAGIRSLADLHSWLYATHLCYSVSRQHEFGRRMEDLDPRLAATY